MKRKISALIVTALVLGILPSPAYAAEINYESGSGTKENPYIIKNKEQLDLLVSDSNTGKEEGKYYQLGANIDYCGQTWSMIGTDSDGFYKAHLDGAGYVIENVVINSNRKNTGFIAFNNASTIENLGLVNITVQGENNTGGLIGLAKDSGFIENIIHNCYVTGKIKGKDFVGGLIGNVQYDVSQVASPITNSFAITDMEGNKYVGGFAGIMQNVEDVRNVFASGTVKGSENVGGLIGYLQAVKIHNAFVQSQIVGEKNVSGLMGTSLMGRVENAYVILRQGTKVEDAVANNSKEYPTQYQNIYYDNINKSKVEEAVALDKSQMTGSETETLMKGFDFENEWTLLSDSRIKTHYPVFKSYTNDKNIRQIIEKELGTTRLYKVEFDIGDGQLLDHTPLIQYVEYNDIVKVPQVRKEHYTVSWDKDLTITNDVVIKAVYTPIAIKNLSIKGTSLMFVGQTSMLDFEYAPKDALPATVKWEVVKGKNILSIDSYGKVSAKKAGQAVIRISLTDEPSIYKDFTMIIKDQTVEAIRKEINKLPENITDVSQVISLIKAYNNLTEEQKKQFDDNETSKVNHAIEQASHLMKQKDHVSVIGQLDLGVEIFLKSLPKTDSICADLSQKTPKYLYEIYDAYLYNHFEEKNIQPSEMVEITLKTQNDLTKVGNLEIMMVHDGKVIFIQPSSITSETITFKTNIVDVFAIIGDEMMDSDSDVLGEMVDTSNKPKIDKTEDITKTGDSMLLAPYIILSLFAVGTYIIIKKKRI